MTPCYFILFQGSPFTADPKKLLDNKGKGTCIINAT